MADVEQLVRFHLDDDQEQLRDSVRSFLEQRLPDEFRRSAANPDYLSRAAHERAVEFCRALHGRGWFVPHWPVEFGGGGAGVVEQLVIREELALAGAPLVNTNGVNMLAPVLFRYGRAEQQEEQLPLIARSERMWAQGYSEPEAGSDLASLRMSAVRDGDHYVLNGQKAWTSNGRLADWIFVLVRTDPTRSRRQEGISFLLVDLATPGIDVRPVDAMTGYPTFAAEFFDDVRVPVDNLLGPEHEGWRVAKALLDHERSNITRAAQAQRFVSELVAWCRQREGTGDDLRRDHVARIELARLVERVEVGRALSYRVADLQARGELTPGQAALSKLYHSEFAVEVKSVGSRLLGMAGLLMPSDELAVLDGHYSEGLLLSLLHRIGGGTSEIQRDVIATTGLGLPR